jgi:hypothetical protein
MKSELIALVIWTFLKTTVGDLGYELTPYQEAPGVYFEDLGHTTSSTTAWTIIVYVPVLLVAGLLHRGNISQMVARHSSLFP